MTPSLATANRSSLPVQHRESCRACGTRDLQPYLTLPALPLTDDLLLPHECGREFIYPVTIHYCPQCALSQTLHDVEVTDYYRQYRYTASASPFVERFMQQLAQSVWQLADMQRADRAIEIGAGDGLQLSRFRDLGANVLGIEPSAPLADLARQRGLEILQGIFDARMAETLAARPTAQAILLSYTFDHLPEPMRALTSIGRLLDAQRGLLIIEVHDLARIVQRHELCLFAHEHATYCTTATLQRLLDRAGFDLIATNLVPEAQRRGNSLLVAAALKGSRYEPLPMIPLEHEADDYARFGKRAATRLMRFTQHLAQRHARGQSVAGYGAGGRGVMTLAASPRGRDLAYVCDQNPAFHGRCTPVSHVPIVPPDHAAMHPVDEIIVFSYGYFEEIRPSLTAHTARGGTLTHLLHLL